MTGKRSKKRKLPWPRNKSSGRDWSKQPRGRFVRQRLVEGSVVNNDISCWGASAEERSHAASIDVHEGPRLPALALSTSGSPRASGEQPPTRCGQRSPLNRFIYCSAQRYGYNGGSISLSLPVSLHIPKNSHHSSWLS